MDWYRNNWYYVGGIIFVALAIVMSLFGEHFDPVRSLLFPWAPDGDWRSDYDNVAFSRNGIQFSDTVKPGTSVYCGNIHNPSGPTSCRFVLSDGERSVSVEGDRPLHRLVFWANEKVTCPEPYIPIRASLGDTLSWHLSYTFR